MKAELQKIFDFFNEAPALEQAIEKIESRLDAIDHQLTITNTNCKWVALSQAAKQLGLTIPALRQRIKRDNYPEGIVWKQRSHKSTIFINLVKLEEYL